MHEHARADEGVEVVREDPERREGAHQRGTHELADLRAERARDERHDHRQQEDRAELHADVEQLGDEVVHLLGDLDHPAEVAQAFRQIGAAYHQAQRAREIIGLQPLAVKHPVPLAAAS